MKAVALPVTLNFPVYYLDERGSARSTLVPLLNGENYERWGGVGFAGTPQSLSLSSASVRCSAWQGRHTFLFKIVRSAVGLNLVQLLAFMLFVNSSQRGDLPLPAVASHDS
jgi:hypothetical protein